MRIFYGKFQVNFYQKISLEDIAASASMKLQYEQVSQTVLILAKFLNAHVI